MVSALDLPQVSYAAMSVGLLYYSLGDLVTAEQVLFFSSFPFLFLFTPVESSLMQCSDSYNL